MAKMTWKYTNGFDPCEFASAIAFEDSVELTEDEKDLFLVIDAKSASKNVVLGLEDGQCMVIANVGSIAATVKNLSADTGTSLASGKTALVVGSLTSDATKCYVLN